MSIATIPTVVLKRLIKLQESREALLGKVAEIEAEITKVFGGGAAAPRGRKPKVGRPAAAKPAKRGKRGKRGATGAKIFAALKAAGSKGIRVADLAENLKMKGQNLHVWFNTTGKKSGKVERVDKGVYRLKA